MFIGLTSSSSRNEAIQEKLVQEKKTPKHIEKVAGSTLLDLNYLSINECNGNRTHKHFLARIKRNIWNLSEDQRNRTQIINHLMVECYFAN